MSETILELCRRLPESEPPLRARWSEFGEELSRAIGVTDFFFYPVGHKADADNIKAAKHVTDTMTARGCWLQVVCVGHRYECAITWALRGGSYPSDPQVIIKASTEELARAAAALLAAHAQMEKTK